MLRFIFRFSQCFGVRTIIMSFNHEVLVSPLEVVIVTDSGLSLAQLQHYVQSLRLIALRRRSIGLIDLFIMDFSATVSASSAPDS